MSDKTKTSEDLQKDYTAEYFNTFVSVGTDANEPHRFAMRSEKFKALAVASVKPTDVILDLGCGRCDAVVHLAHRCAFVYGLDYAEPGIVIGKEVLTHMPKSLQDKVKLIVGDAKHIPLPDGLIDTVINMDVIEHVNFDEQHDLVAEAYRVLRPGGKFILLTPLVGEPGFLHRLYRLLFKRGKESASSHRTELEEHMHIGELSIRQMKSLLTKHGFSCQVKSVTSHWQDVDDSLSAWQKFVRYRLFLPVFATKQLAIGTKR